MKGISLKTIKLNTSESIIFHEGEWIDFRNCVNAEEVKAKIEHDAVSYCRRKTAGHNYCLKRLKDSDFHQCFLQKDFLNNYFKATVGFIPKASSHFVKIYIEYLINVIDLVKDFSLWRDSILNKRILSWQGELIMYSDEFQLNKINEELSKILSKFRSIRPIEKNRYRYKIFVEGIDDQRALTEIGEKINCFLFPDNFEVIGRISNIQNSIILIKNLKKENWDIIILLDNNEKWKNKINQLLLKQKIISKANIIFLKKSLEDSYPAEIQYKAFRELQINPNIKYNFLKKYFYNSDEIEITSKLQKDLIHNKINFKKNFKEQYNKILLQKYLEDLSASEIKDTIIMLYKKTESNKRKFYKTL
jgi:hypothetical protein